MQSDMQKNVLIALVLSFGILLVFSNLTQGPEDSQKQSSTADTAPQKVTERTQTDTPDVTIQSPEETDSTKPSPDLSTPSGTTPESFEAQYVNAGNTVPFETKKIRGHFNRRGAHLSSIGLKKFYRLDEPNHLFDLVNRNGRGLGFNLKYPKKKNRVYKQVQTEDSSTYTFQKTTPDQLLIRKSYHFDTKAYRASLSVTLHNGGNQSVELDKIDFPTGAQGQGGRALRWGPGFGVGRESKSRLDQVYLYYAKGGEMDYTGGGGGIMNSITSFFTGGEDSPQDFFRGPIDWMAVSNRYFIAAMVPSKSYDMMYMDKVENEGDTFTAWAGHGTFSLGPNETREFTYNMYLGPKKYDKLQQFYGGTQQTIYSSWIPGLIYLILPLLTGMNWIYSFIPNYGIAIILLSMAIKLVLYPLTKKGYSSMHKMKQLQPKMEELQEKYDDDREKLNQKMMELFQEHDVTPMGGCFPIIMQIPIFIALYQMLEYSIELRGAYFMLWVTDLSAPDPYYILPVLMGITMFFQQKAMAGSGGSGAAGQQQKMMMYIMPPVFTIMFSGFPVGLVLYWMTNSLATIAQYQLITKELEDLDS
ncbi:MAG: membrane protein insertase YidC [bacterium]